MVAVLFNIVVGLLAVWSTVELLNLSSTLTATEIVVVVTAVIAGTWTVLYSYHRYKRVGYPDKAKAGYTQLLLQDGREKNIGELFDSGEERLFSMDKEPHPSVFLCHRGPDSKEEIVRPTAWFLRNVLGVDTFIDEDTVVVGQNVEDTLIAAAYSSTHAVVILSPTFRQSKWCVKELNTLLKRRQQGEAIVLPALWQMDSLSGYDNYLNEIIPLRVPTSEPADRYLVNYLWPHLIQSLNLDTSIPTREALNQYIREQQHGSGSVPVSLGLSPIEMERRKEEQGKKFIKLPQLNEPRSKCGVAFWNSYHILVVGGQKNGKPLRSVELFDARLQQWSPLPDLQVPRADCTAIVVDDVLYVFGGRDGSKTLDSFETLHMENHNQKTLKSLPAPRQDIGVAQILEQIYLFGGLVNPATNNAWEVQTKTKITRNLLSMMIERQMPMLVPDGDRIIVVGGRGVSTQWLGSVCIFQIATETWDNGSIPDMIKAERVLAAYKKDETLVVRSESGVQQFDFTTNSWNWQGSGFDWTGGLELDRVAYSSRQGCLVCIDVDDFVRTLDLSSLDCPEPEYFSTALINGEPEHVGELQVGYVSNPGLAWPMRKRSETPLVYIAHHGDDAKELIAAPLASYLRAVHRVDVFFDKDSMPISDEKKHTLITNAHHCTHAVVILSPNFRKSHYCVKELNTFIGRWKNRSGISLFISLWNVDNIDEYESSDLDAVIGHRPQGLDRVGYINDLFTEISKVLQG